MPVVAAAEDVHQGVGEAGQPAQHVAADVEARIPAIGGQMQRGFCDFRVFGSLCCILRI